MDTPEATSRGIAEAVKAALKAAEVSYRDAAIQAGIPLTTLQRRLSGYSPFRITELRAIADVTGTTVVDLVAAAEKSDAA